MTTREDVIRMAREVGFGLAVFNGVDGDEVVTSDCKIITDELIRFAALIAAAKQEECAKVCEQIGGKMTDECDEAIQGYWPDQVSFRCAATIRALP